MEPIEEKYAGNTVLSSLLTRFKSRSLHRHGLVAIFALMVTSAAVASNSLPTRTIVAFGDSYFSGYGVQPHESFPAQLELALRGHGHNARVVNEGVPGETIADGLIRLDRTLAKKPDLIILELGANDAEQGLDPEISRANLDKMLARIRAAHVPVLLCGAIAPIAADLDYQNQFNPIYPTLAAKHQVALYPFVLDGVATDIRLIQGDGEHPNPKGVRVMVSRMLPAVEQSFREALR